MPVEPPRDQLLSADGLCLERGGRQLFQGFSFSLSAGQWVQLLGANGAGKTSLLRILAGLSRHGYEGKVVRNSDQLFLGHHSAVKGLLTPRENLAWHVDGQGNYSTLQIDWALEQVGLYGFEDTPCHSLSAGQHRRVNLARLYLSDSPLWLLDEPFTAIDRQGVADLEARMLAHVHGGGAIIMTSHQALSVDFPVQSLQLESGARV